MKKLLSLFIILLVVIGNGSAQTFPKLTSTEHGLYSHFIVLEEGKQPIFHKDSINQLLKLDQETELVLENTISDSLGFIHYRYFQTLHGIPIENSIYLIHTKNGRLTGLNGEIISKFTPQIKLSIKNNTINLISPAKAIQAAMSYIKAKKYAWQDEAMEAQVKEITKNIYATYLPKPILVWYNNDTELVPSKLRLAYKIKISTIDPISSANYFIDATTKELLGKNTLIYDSDVTFQIMTQWSGFQTLHCDLINNIYYLRDITRGSGIEVKNKNKNGNPTFDSNLTSWVLTGIQQDAFDIMYGLEKTYDFYKSEFNRNSIDNSGMKIIGYANDPKLSQTKKRNAKWRDNAIYFGNGLTSIDIIAHEFTHGVTEKTCGLIYKGESGAINESLSDIMGKGAEFLAKGRTNARNWTIGADCNYPLRAMDAPLSTSCPDTYKGKYWVSKSSKCDSTTDYCGVHTNSSLGNYMFYLLVSGGSGRNNVINIDGFGNYFNFSGIDLSKALKIIYRSQSIYLTPNSDYPKWRTACISSASDLFGSGSKELKAVVNAWYAVGIGSSTCGKPQNISISSTSDMALVNWEKVDNAEGYILAYKKMLSSEWTEINVNTSNSFPISGISPNTSYTVRIKAICSNGGSIFSDSISFTSKCETPKIKQFTINPNIPNFYLEWESTSSAYYYTIQYKKTSDSNWNKIPYLTTPTYVSNRLDSDKEYILSLTSDCENIISEPILLYFTSLSIPAVGTKCSYIQTVYENYCNKLKQLLAEQNRVLIGGLIPDINIKQKYNISIALYKDVIKKIKNSFPNCSLPNCTEH